MAVTCLQLALAARQGIESAELPVDNLAYSSKCTRCAGQKRNQRLHIDGNTVTQLSLLLRFWYCLPLLLLLMLKQFLYICCWASNLPAMAVESPQLLPLLLFMLSC